MDFEIVTRQIVKAYQTGRYSHWELDDFIKVFSRFYRMYVNEMGREHPFLKTETIARVMGLLIEDENDTLYCSADYLESDILEHYFNTRFRSGCDYSIVHFVSGHVREIKTFESM